MSAPIADCVDDSSREAQCGDDWSISPVLQPTRIELGLGYVNWIAKRYIRRPLVRENGTRVHPLKN